MAYKSKPLDRVYRKPKRDCVCESFIFFSLKINNLYFFRPSSPAILYLVLTTDGTSGTKGNPDVTIISAILYRRRAINGVLLRKNVRDMGLVELAEHEYESIDEMKYADELVGRILFSRHSNLQDLGKLRIGETREMLECDLQLNMARRSEGNGEML